MLGCSDTERKVCPLKLPCTSPRGLWYRPLKLKPGCRPVGTKPQRLRSSGDTAGQKQLFPSESCKCSDQQVLQGDAQARPGRGQSSQQQSASYLQHCQRLGLGTSEDADTAIPARRCKHSAVLPDSNLCNAFLLQRQLCLQPQVWGLCCHLPAAQLVICRTTEGTCTGIEGMGM